MQQLGGIVDDVEAAVKGSKLEVRLSLGQILVLISLAASVVFSVWVTTRELGWEVKRLSFAIDDLRSSFTDVNTRTLKHDTEIEVLKDRIERVQ